MQNQQSAPFTEPIATHDIFVTDLARVEHIGGTNFRLYFVAEQHSLHDGQAELMVVCRMVASFESIRRGIFTAAKAIGLRIIAELSICR